MTTETPTPAFRPVFEDPVATVQLDPPGDPDLDPPMDDSATWGTSLGFRITFGDDFDFHDGRELHVTVAVGPDFPKAGGMQIRTVTPEQLEAHAAHLVALAQRARQRREQVKTGG